MSFITKNSNYYYLYANFKSIKAKEEAEAKRLKEIAEHKARMTEEARRTSQGSNWGTSVILPPRNIDSITYPESAFVSTDPVAPSIGDLLPSAPTLPSSSGASKSNISVAPLIDRGSKPSSPPSTSSPGLRTVVIPSCLSAKFLMLAGHNTLNNIETCGILAGILVS